MNTKLFKLILFAIPLFFVGNFALAYDTPITLWQMSSTFQNLVSSTNPYILNGSNSGNFGTSTPWGSTGYSFLSSNPPVMINASSAISLALGLQDIWSIHFWIRPNSIGGNQGLISADGGYQNNGMLINGTGGLRVYYSTNFDTFYTSATTISANNWHMVDLVNNSGTTTLYIDGLPSNGFTNGGNWSPWTNNQFYFGDTGAGDPFNGSVAQIIAWKGVAIGSSTITEYWNDGTGCEILATGVCYGEEPETTAELTVDLGNTILESRDYSQNFWSGTAQIATTTNLYGVSGGGGSALLELEYCLGGSGECLLIFDSKFIHFSAISTTIDWIMDKSVSLTSSTYRVQGWLYDINDNAIASTSQQIFNVTSTFNFVDDTTTENCDAYSFGLFSSTTVQATICAAKQAITGILRWFFVPTNLGFDFLHSSLEDSKQIFPFSIMFNFASSTQTALANIATSTPTATLNFKTLTGVPAISLTFLSSSTLENAVGSSTKDTIFNWMENGIWLGSLIATALIIL